MLLFRSCWNCCWIINFLEQIQRILPQVVIAFEKPIVVNVVAVVVVVNTHITKIYAPEGMNLQTDECLHGWKQDTKMQVSNLTWLHIKTFATIYALVKWAWYKLLCMRLVIAKTTYTILELEWRRKPLSQSWLLHSSNMIPMLLKMSMHLGFSNLIGFPIWMRWGEPKNVTILTKFLYKTFATNCALVTLSFWTWI